MSRWTLSARRLNYDWLGRKVSSPTRTGIGWALNFPLREKEDGYRHVELLIYAPYNYVGVFIRENWNVISLDDLEYDEESGEQYIKKGKDYSQGVGEWRRLSYHDSCWRSDGVDRLLHEYKDRLQTLSAKFGPDPFWDIVEVPADLPMD